MDFVTRSQWGAPAKSPAAALPSAKGVKIHYLGTAYRPGAHSTCPQFMRNLRQAHLNNKEENWLDVAYNLLVCAHGTVYEGRGAYKRSGANGSAKLNADHYAVLVCVGSEGHTVPGPAQVDGARDAIDYLRQREAGQEIKGHKDGYNTDCPGDWLYRWVRAGAPRPGTEDFDVAGMKHGAVELKTLKDLASGEWHRFTVVPVAGPYHYAVDAYLTLAGVIPGAQVQGRFVEMDAKGRIVQKMPIAERVGSQGSSFVDFSRAAATAGKGSKVALDLLVYNMTDAHPTATPFQVTGGSVEYNYVPQ